MEQRLSAGICVRLERAQDTVEVHFLRGVQRGLHLARMMRVIVYDGCAVRHFADQLETAGRTGELVQTALGSVTRHTEKLSSGAARQSVQHVMTPRNGQRHLSVLLPLYHNGKAVVAVLVAHVGRVNVRGCARAEGTNLAVDACHTAHCMRVIAVDDNKTVHRGQLGKLMERVDDVVDILEEVEMILLHIEDNRNGRCKAQERVAVFAAFSHKTALAADTERTADGRQVAADHNGRVHLRLHGHERHHRGGSCLAVRAGQADHVVIIAHEVSPCLGTLHNRNAQLMGADNLRIFVMHSSGAHDERRTLDVLRLVLVGNLCTQSLQPCGNIRTQTVGAGNRHTAAEQQLAKRIHGYAADADQVDAFLIFNVGLNRQSHFPKPPVFLFIRFIIVQNRPE